LTQCKCEEISKEYFFRLTSLVRCGPVHTYLNPTYSFIGSALLGDGVAA
jgi:hypothetical protein